MSEGAKILRGPWRERAEAERTPPASRPAEAGRSGGIRRDGPASDLAEGRGLVAPDGEVLAPNRIHLGFVVRDCAVALGRTPTPAELAHWANHQVDDRGEYRLFGRDITAAEAKVILAHPGRTVTVRPDRARGRGPGDPPLSSRG